MQTIDRETAYHRLQAFIQRHVADPDKMPEYVPPDFSLLFDGPLQGWEGVMLGMLVTSALWRGASATDCARYVEAGDIALPFQGCEEQLFDLLLANIRARASEPDMAVRMVRALAQMQTRLFEILDFERNGPELPPGTTAGPTPMAS